MLLLQGFFLFVFFFCPQNNRDVLLCLMQLKEVVLKSGKVLRADVCVVGVGKELSLWVQSPAGWWCFAQQRRSWRGRGSDVPAPLSCHTQDCIAKLKKAFLEPPPQNATENISGK